MAKVTLAVVAGGASYECYAEDLIESAMVYFKPSDDVDFRILKGVEGWPNGTLFRHVCLLDQHDWEGKNDYVFLCDADMRFEGEVGPEILPWQGIAAVRHPGYLGTIKAGLPYERRLESEACVAPEDGKYYYAGGFVGGTNQAMKELCRHMDFAIRSDLGRGVIALWHDESHLNRFLIDRNGPAVALTPAYVHPDDDSYYLTNVWKQNYPRLLVALDKTREERGVR